MDKIILRKKSKRLPEISAEPGMLEKLAAIGLSDENMANVFCITYRQFAKARNRNHELHEILQKGRQQAFAKVHDALLRKATGFENKEIAYMKVKDKIVAHPVVKYYPPDKKAIIDWFFQNKKRFGVM